LNPGKILHRLLTLFFVATVAVACSDSETCEDNRDGGAHGRLPNDFDAASDASTDATSNVPSDGGVDSATGGPAEGYMSAQRCTGPLRCAEDDSCPTYRPLTECPVFGQVREGTCIFGTVKFRVSFNGGGAYIEYWDARTNKLIAIDSGSDVHSYCDDTSVRILIGDVARADECEENQSMQRIVCTGTHDDAGADDGGG
jgi:hypothetical protein